MRGLSGTPRDGILWRNGRAWKKNERQRPLEEVAFKGSEISYWVTGGKASSPELSSDFSKSAFYGALYTIIPHEIMYCTNFNGRQRQ